MAGDSHFTEDDVRVLAAVLDDIIPPSTDGRLPGAGDLGLVRHVEVALGRTPGLLGMIDESLAALRALAARRHPQGLAGLSRQEQRRLVHELGSTEHAFPPFLVLHVYTGYYQHPLVVAALGLEPRPPHPAGYTMEPDDPSLLESVRRRPKMYREC